jgi:hypothetical protein
MKTSTNIDRVSSETDNGILFLTITPEPTYIFQAISTTGDLRVTVKDKNGAPVVGASISSTSQPIGQSALNGTSGADGILVFSGVMPGSYMNHVSKSGYVSGSAQGNVVAGSTNGVSLTLQVQSPGGGGGVPGFPFEAVAIGFLLCALWLRVRARRHTIKSLVWITHQSS